MSGAPSLVVFSDLDGTLLDHDTYSWAEATPALDALEARGVPLVLVSSKTRAELLPLRIALGNTHPYIVENGAATFIPPGYFDARASVAADAGDSCVSEGPSRAELQDALSAARSDGGYRFTTFAELATQGIVRETGLEPAQADAANERAASEPLLWQDTEEHLTAFADRMAAQNLRCVRGGRFVHVMGQFDKADAVAGLHGRFEQCDAPRQVVSVALGDGPNDLEMLALADIAVVVKGRHGHAMPVRSGSRVIRTTKHGPAGWREAVLEILDGYPAA
ncbi:MAG: HAD-IIB family hydrolase [Pseudomonadota bacterium]